MLPSYTPMISVLIFKTWLCYAVILRKRAQYNQAQGDNPLELQEISSLAPQQTCVQGVSGRNGWKFAWSHILLSSLADEDHKGCFLHYISPHFAPLSLHPSFSEAWDLRCLQHSCTGLPNPGYFQISPDAHNFKCKHTLRVGWSAEIKDRKRNIKYQRWSDTCSHPSSFNTR